MYAATDRSGYADGNRPVASPRTKIAKITNTLLLGPTGMSAIRPSRTDSRMAPPKVKRSRTKIGLFLCSCYTHIPMGISQRSGRLRGRPMTAKKTTESNAWPVTTTPDSPPADLDALRADIARTRATLADTAAALAAKADARVRT